MEIKEKVFKIIVKTNSKSNDIIGYDKDRVAYRINVKAKPVHNKANIEILKFLSKYLKKRIKIIKGFKNKEKTIEILD